MLYTSTSKIPHSDTCLVDIGAVMGMDIGGSLAKLVYFEKVDLFGEDEETMNTVSQNDSEDSQEYTNRFDTSSPGLSEFQSRKSGSGPNLSNNFKHTEEQSKALKNFYTFMDTAKIIGGKFSVRDEHLTVRCPEFGGLLHFFRFETRHMDRAISLVLSSRIADHLHSVGCTGGGAYKYEPFMRETLKLRVQQNDEMDCIVRGLQFATENIEGEVYSFCCDPNKIYMAPGRGTSSTVDGDQDTFRNMRMRHMASFIDQVDVSERVYCGLDRLKASYPALVICIGSGVSILKVDGPSKFERVSGSSIGGGTFLGLCRLLTGANDFDMALEMSSDGDSDVADMVVGDIYGRGYNKFQLSSDTLACSFGKVGMSEDPRENLSDSDISKSLMVMVTMNIGQVAHLNAKLHDTSTIFFIGNFLRHNDISARRLSFAIDYWSGGNLVFRIEGFGLWDGWWMLLLLFLYRCVYIL